MFLGPDKEDNAEWRGGGEGSGRRPRNRLSCPRAFRGEPSDQGQRGHKPKRVKDTHAIAHVSRKTM